MTFIILDRDGVINYDSSEYIKSPAEWLPIPGSLPAIAKLNRAGFRVIIATNQSGIARGFYDIAMLNAIHEKLINELKVCGGHIEEIFFCPHHPDDGCGCRKPKPGMLYDIEKQFSVRLDETFFIGDSIVDYQAAVIVGCQPLMVKTGKWQKALEINPAINDCPHFLDLAQAAQYVIKHMKRKG